MQDGSNFVRFNDAAKYRGLTKGDLLREIAAGLPAWSYTGHLEIDDTHVIPGPIVKVLNASTSTVLTLLAGSKFIDAQILDPVCESTVSYREKVSDLLFRRVDLDAFETERPRHMAVKNAKCHVNGVLKATKDFRTIILGEQKEELPVKKASMLKCIVEHGLRHPGVWLRAAEILHAGGLTNATGVKKEFKHYPAAWSLIEEGDHGEFRLRALPDFLLEFI